MTAVVILISARKMKETAIVTAIVKELLFAVVTTAELVGIRMLIVVPVSIITYNLCYFSIRI